jgi:hypothetical protein
MVCGRCFETSGGREDQVLVINKAKHPKIWEACDLILYDGGGHIGGRRLRETFSLDLSETTDLDTIEVALSGLSKEDFEELLIGDQDKALQIMNNSDDLIVAVSLLNTFFDADETTE